MTSAPAGPADQQIRKAGTVEQSTSDLGPNLGPDLRVAWRGVVDDLQPNQRAWLRASEPVTLHESTAIVAVPNDFTRNQLEGRLRAQLEDALTVRFDREIRIAVTVNPQLEEAGPVAPPVLDESTSREIDMSTIPHEAPPAPCPSVLGSRPSTAGPGPAPSRPA